MKVFCDSDGCLADFESHFRNLFGIECHSIPDPKMWEMILEIADEFWETIPLKYGAHQLWAMVQPYDPSVLTGCHKSHFELCAAKKQIWHKKHFGEATHIITCKSREKPLYMQNPGDILIDDTERHVRRWIKAGGRAVHYRKLDQAIADFTKLIAKP